MASTPTSASLWTRGFTLLCVAEFLGYAQHFTLQPALPLYITHLGGSPFIVGLVIAANGVTSVLSRPIIGYWVDRYPVRGNDGHYLVEPTTYRARDGSWVRLLRDLDASFRIYATTSRNGTTWDTPSRSDIPDSPSLSCAGTLPDGRRYLINNPVPNSRDPLVLRLSQDGLSFGPAQVLRRGAPALRHAGLHKGPGFQYPSAGLAENALWVVYSVNKEDIEISRIPLQDLNGAGRRR